jgi:hypothetical protein
MWLDALCEMQFWLFGLAFEFWICRAIRWSLWCTCKRFVERISRIAHPRGKWLIFKICVLLIECRRIYKIISVVVVFQEIDMVATALSVTYPRSKFVDFTFAFSDDPISLLIPYPRLDSTISGIVKPFQSEALKPLHYWVMSHALSMFSLQIIGMDWDHP